MLFVLIAVLLVVSPFLIFSAQAPAAVTTQLGLVVDGSSSISSSEFAIIREGIAAAVRNASQLPHDGTVELTVVQFGGWWSASVRARVEVYPTVITTANYESVASIIGNMSQMKGLTPLADGLLLCWSQMNGSANFPIATKQVINVATNGEPNVALRATPPPSWVTLLGSPPGDGNGDATWVRNGAVSEGLDELDAEAMGTGPDINWMRDGLVYPQPGTIAPPHTPGWVQWVADATEFAVAVGEKFRIVTQAPHACFTWTPEEPQVCENVTFNASCSTPNGGYITDWDWDFGDNTTGSGEIVTHHYTEWGYYNVTLTVTDNETLSDSTTKTIYIKGYPQADFTWSPTSPQVGELVTFNGCLSTPDGGIIDSYEWDFGDTSPHEFGKIVNHTYTTFGNFTVTLNVTDSEGKWDTESKVITVRAHPHADFTWSPTDPQVCETVTFDASASTPDGGVIVSWDWDFGDNTTGSGEIVTHHYDNYGNYTVTLNVTDSEGKWDTESKIITVREHPQADFTWSPLSPQVGEMVTFDASASTPDGGTIVSYVWDFGDSNSGSGKIVNHTYATFGNYTVTLNVTDSEGKWDVVSRDITVRAHPHADFTWSPPSPQEGEEVTFDASPSTPDGGTIVSYEWDFGDTSPHQFGKIVNHTYSTYGTYTVILNVTDSEGKWDTESKNITVRAHPHADFTWSPTSPQVNETVTFDASASTPDGGTIVSYDWDFGDGHTDSGKIVYHSYASYGNFTVILNVTDSEGKWDTESKVITVRAHPHADFTWSPTEPQEGEDVTFDGSPSTPDGGTIISYEWDFGDSSPHKFGKIVTHQYSTHGTYTVTLNVTDSEGKWDTESKMITVTAKPHADFTWSPLSPQVCENVTFDASASTPDGGTIISYDWDFGDGENGTGKIVIHHYSDWGDFTVTLNVTDSEGKWDTVSKNITVREHPQADFTWSPLSPQVDEDVTFDASSSTPNGGTIVGYDWDFGDGHTDSGKIVVHQFSNWGTFTVTLNVTDSEGKWDVVSKNITVRAHPHADFTWSPTDPQVSETVTFDGSPSTPDGGTIVSYEWDFGDGNFDSGKIVTHHYSAPGDYTVTLNVTDSEGKWDTESKIITVTAPPHADFTWSPTSPQVGETVTFDASASTPDGGTITSYEWDFGDTSPHKFGKIVTHTYTTYGTYTVTLNVTDSEGKWDIETKTITVRAHPNADFTWSPLQPEEDQTVTFDASASTPDGGTIVSYEWDFGDTSPPVFGKIVTHAYTTAGTYTIILNVTDSEGKWDTESKQITVKSPTPPVVGGYAAPIDIGIGKEASHLLASQIGLAFALLAAMAVTILLTKRRSKTLK